MSSTCLARTQRLLRLERGERPDRGQSPGGRVGQRSWSWTGIGIANRVLTLSDLAAKLEVVADLSERAA
jgi:hypothetical protein